MTHVSGNVVLDGYRFRNDDGSETAATWKAAANTAATISTGETFRLRAWLRETAGGNTLAPFNLEYSLNSSAFAAVSTTTPVRWATSTNVSDGAATTQQISTGTYASGVIDNNGDTGNQGLQSNSLENEYVLTLNAAQLSDSDTITFRTTNTQAYNQTPTLTVSIASAGITGSLVAQEQNQDSLSATGSVTVSGALAVQEQTQDLFAGLGSVAVSGTVATQEQTQDLFAGSGTVAWPEITGSLVVQEQTQDIFAASGTLGPVGLVAAMAAQEQGNDIFSGTGEVAVSGNLLSQEAEYATFSASGSVSVSAVLQAQESTDDLFSGAGSVALSGSLLVQGEGQDVLAASGTVTEPGIIGNLTAQESTQDLFNAAGQVFSSGSLVAQGEGQDVFSGAAQLLVDAQLLVQEIGDDVFAGEIVDLSIFYAVEWRIVGETELAGSATNIPNLYYDAENLLPATHYEFRASQIVGGSQGDWSLWKPFWTANGLALSAQEQGDDSFAGVVAVSVSGDLIVQETLFDLFVAIGEVSISGTVAAQGQNVDLFSAAGIVELGEVTGNLAAQESQHDSTNINFRVRVSGALTAQGESFDVLASTATVAVDCSMAAQEEGQGQFSGSAQVTVSGEVAAQEEGYDDLTADGSLAVSVNVDLVAGNSLAAGRTLAKQVGQTSYLTAGQAAGAAIALTPIGGAGVSLNPPLTALGEGVLFAPTIGATDDLSANFGTGAGRTLSPFTGDGVRVNLQPGLSGVLGKLLSLQAGHNILFMVGVSEGYGRELIPAPIYFLGRCKDPGSISRSISLTSSAKTESLTSLSSGLLATVSQTRELTTSSLTSKLTILRG